MATQASEAIRLIEVKDWLTYYSECRQYLLAMGHKFTSLLGQSSLFSFTASAAIFTLAEKLKVGYPVNLWVAVPSAVGLLMYAVIIRSYFLQIRRTGQIMLDIEARLFGSDAQLGLIHALRASPGAFYGKTWTFVFVLLYVAALAVLPIAAVIVSL